MTPREIAKMDPRVQGMINKVQGAAFEGMIEQACTYYRDKGIADIEKTPEPMKPIQKLGKGKYIAVFTKRAQADFKGLLAGGTAVNFEAKYTDREHLKQSEVSDDQAERLERAHNMGGKAFVLCSFSRGRGYYRIPWTVWRSMKERFRHKYITPEEAAPWAIHIGGPGVLLFLEKLEEDR